MLLRKSEIELNNLFLPELNERPSTLSETSTQGRGIKILRPKQILQRLFAGNTCADTSW